MTSTPNKLLFLTYPNPTQKFHHEPPGFASPEVITPLMIFSSKSRLPSEILRYNSVCKRKRQTNRLKKTGRQMDRDERQTEVSQN